MVPFTIHFNWRWLVTWNEFWWIFHLRKAKCECVTHDNIIIKLLKLLNILCSVTFVTKHLFAKSNPAFDSCAPFCIVCLDRQGKHYTEKRNYRFLKATHILSKVALGKKRNCFHPHWEKSSQEFVNVNFFKRGQTSFVYLSSVSNHSKLLLRFAQLCEQSFM